MTIAWKKLYRYSTTWLLRFLVIGTVLLVVAMVVVSNLGGNGDPQRRALEGLMYELTGYSTRVHTLHMYQIFPTFLADFEDMVSMGSDQSTPVLILKRGYYMHDVYERLFGDYPIIDIQMDHLLIAPGILGPFDVHINKARIEQTNKNETKTFFLAQGEYGEFPISLRLPMDIKQHSVWRPYRFVGNRPILLEIGPFQTQLFLNIQKDHYTLSLEKAKIDEFSFSALLTSQQKEDGFNLLLTRIKGCGDLTKVTATVKKENGLVFNPLTLTFKDESVSGTALWEDKKQPMFKWRRQDAEKGEIFEKCLLAPFTFVQIDSRGQTSADE